MSRELRRVLRERGLQVTAQRLAVLRAVRDDPHSTAEAIAAAARRRLGAISRQAVYDALGALVEGGLLRRLRATGAAALYEPRLEDGHHHAICRACGSTVDVAATLGDAACETAAGATGFRIDAAEVVFWGLCPPCRDGPPSARP